MVHPLDEAIAEARRALALNTKLRSINAALDTSISAIQSLDDKAYVEKWTRIEKALVEQRRLPAISKCADCGWRGRQRQSDGYVDVCRHGALHAPRCVAPEVSPPDWCPLATK